MEEKVIYLYKHLETFLKQNKFDLIITTNSPRFELAIQKAAHQLSIKCFQ